VIILINFLIWLSCIVVAFALHLASNLILLPYGLGLGYIFRIGIYSAAFGVAIKLCRKFNQKRKKDVDADTSSIAISDTRQKELLDKLFQGDSHEEGK
jgi:hypothetical protein